MASPSSPPPKVRLEQGTYVGVARPSSALYPKALAAFLGVPYAQSTAGANRFRPPQPLPPSSADAAEVSAAAYGEACPGINAMPPGIRAGEDCLNANVFVPASAFPPPSPPFPSAPDGARGRRLAPVVVYVHGGGFNMGLGAERDMASFVSWAADDIVGVSFNYRVGPLGFLAPPAAEGDGDGEAGALNVGLRDQQMLFGWVRDNIARFGGDPTNVTVMGLSAGAHSIGHHIIYYGSCSSSSSSSSSKSNSASPPVPFHKAILESGAATARSVLHPAHPRNAAQYHEFLAAAGGASGSVLARLRALPLQRILDAGRAVWDAHAPAVRWPFQPVVDADVIPDLPIRSWRAGRALRIPLITGFNTNEGTSFVPARADSDADFRAFFARLLPAASAADMDRLAASLYPDPVSSPSPAADSSSSSSSSSPPPARYLSAPVPRGMARQWRRLDAAYADYAYTCPVLQTAHYMSQLHNGDGPSSSSSKVYVYHFAPLAPPWGTANHADNAPFAAHDLAQLLGLGGGPSAAARAGGEEEKGEVGGPLLAAAEARLPGVVAASAAMHAAYVRFVVSRDGDPNRGDEGTGGGGTTTKMSTSASTSTAGKAGPLHWPAFESPFRGGTVAAPELVRAAAAASSSSSSSGALGRLVIFGEGNDERLKTASSTSRGTAARAVALSERELELCRFWWERVELSQGLGTRVVQPAASEGPVKYKANL